jgi:hypothetical protein
MVAFMDISSLCLALSVSGLVALLGGCMLGTTINEDGSAVTHHLGYVRHILPPFDSRDPHIRVQAIETVGIAADRGFTLGYKRNSYIYVPLAKPGETPGAAAEEACNIVVVVENKVQLEHAIEHLKHLEGDLCVTVLP